VTRVLIDIKGQDFRKPDHDIAPFFVNRWSPRAMSGEEIALEELMRMFEAARWAMSSMNNQPWRFLYALRNTRHWEKFFGLLTPNNQAWCKNAAALIVVVSKKTFDHSGKPSRTHTYDTGAAWYSFALQGTMMGLVVHGMQGFDYDKAASELGVTDEYEVEAMARSADRGTGKTWRRPCKSGRFLRSGAMSRNSSLTAGILKSKMHHWMTVSSP